MSTDAVIPDLNLERSTELESADEQVAEETKEIDWLQDLSQHPGWRLVAEKLDRYIERYDKPVFDPKMSYEEIGKEYTVAQTVAGVLKDVRDSVSPRS